MIWLPANFGSNTALELYHTQKANVEDHISTAKLGYCKNIFGYGFQKGKGLEKH